MLGEDTFALVFDFPRNNAALVISYHDDGDT